MKETWENIKGYEGYYQISNFGVVKRLKTIVKSKSNGVQTKKEKVLKAVDSKGYLHITLCKDNFKKNKPIHRLVAETFIPNPLNEYTVNHIDKNKYNNRVDNLEWCSLEYNNRYSKEKKIIQLDKNNKVIKTWNSASEVERQLKINNSSIIQCCIKNRKTAGGFKWQYLD